MLRMPFLPRGPSTTPRQQLTSVDARSSIAGCIAFRLEPRFSEEFILLKKKKSHETRPIDSSQKKMTKIVLHSVASCFPFTQHKGKQDNQNAHSSSSIAHSSQVLVVFASPLAYEWE